MTVYVIKLPNGRDCRVGTYAQAWRTLKTLKPDAMCPGFGYFPEEASRILRKMRDAMMDRINQHDPRYGKGRKWSTDCFYQAWRDSRALRDITQRRFRVYQFETSEAHRRFSHLLASRHD